MKNDTSLKIRFHNRLDKIGLNQAEFSRRIGAASPQTVANWIKRETIPANYLFKVARELNCNAEWLLTGFGEVEPVPPGLKIIPRVLEDIIYQVLSGIDHTQSTLSRREIARLIAQVYALHEMTGTMPDVHQAVRLASIRLEPATKEENHQ